MIDTAVQMDFQFTRNRQLRTVNKSPLTNTIWGPTRLFKTH